jgi:hypothetical protein
MSNNTITINGQTITVPEGMQVNLSNGAIQIVPVTHKVVRVPYGTKAHQTVNTAPATKAVKASAKSSKKSPKDKTPFLSKEELAAIKAFFLAKQGCVTTADVDALAQSTGIPAGKIGYRINKHRQAVCYGFLTVANNDAFLASLTAQGSWIAGMFNSPKVEAARAENLAKAQTPVMA